MSKENTNPYTQICVWPGTTLDGSTPAEFEAFFAEEMHTRVRFLSEVPTTIGRTDIFFRVHTDDIIAFSLPRLKMGIRWWEDVVVYNDNSHLYTDEVLATYPPTW
jgi:hypothetical protein